MDVHSVYATSLPTSHPSFSPQRVLEMSEQWKAHPLPKRPIKLFIGVLSATNHFAERMAVRKTWMQSSAIKSSNVVVRFFVALVRTVGFLHIIFSHKRLYNICTRHCCQCRLNIEGLRGRAIYILNTHL